MPMDQPLDDYVWIARCVARIIELAPQLDPELARPIAQQMASRPRPRWRSMTPEGAAQAVFYGGTQRTSTAT